MDFIQGEVRKQYIMFPDLLDDYITEDNPTRVIDAYIEHLDLDKLGFTKAVPNITGRPMYCAKDMLKLYVYGYMNRTRSSRRLEAETKKNVEVMWLLCKLSPDHITSIADTGYNVGTDIAECIMNNIEPHVSMKEDFLTFCIPVKEEEAEEPTTYENGRLIYLKDRNVVVCPMGKCLLPTTYRKSRGVAIYASPKACNHCTKNCVNGTSAKKFERTMKIEEFSREYNADDLYLKQIIVKRDKKLLRRRKAIVEHPFGTLKRTMDSGYCLMKGIDNVRGEFSLTFLAYNMKRAINLLGTKELIEAIEAR